jgi:hypothetical protein
MAHRAGVSFELERLEMQGDELVVTGHWSGVRGLRFVRPMLVAEDQRILATLEHKPWAPALDRPWIAAFPWARGDLDVGALRLAVGSQVSVALGDAAEPQVELEPLRAPAKSVPPQPDRLAELEAERGELARSLAGAERDRDRLRAQLDEAVAAREAAVRTRDRMELVHDESLQAREAAHAALATAQSQREEANAQRDEVLLAYRGLQHHVQSERAHEERVAEADGERDPEAPIGVRTMPAARTVMAELQRPALVSKLPFSVFDLWVMRVLGTVAAACFILLLLSILRVFI